MRTDLLGLALSEALELLREEGVEPIVRKTCAPRRAEETRGTLRVVAATDTVLTAARFLDPISDP